MRLFQLGETLEINLWQIIICRADLIGAILVLKIPRGLPKSELKISIPVMVGEIEFQGEPLPWGFDPENWSWQLKSWLAKLERILIIPELNEMMD